MGGIVTVFNVIYGSGSACPTFTFLQTISAYAENATAPTASKLAEVHFFDNFLYVADRVDKLFSGDNSIETLSLDSTGALTFLQQYDSCGTYPRTFRINKAGTLVAVRDQTTANLAVLKRDTTTGLLGPLLANLRIGATGTPENEDGLSAVVWDE
jgi:6-phosphogluconolactonase (cycloisomerase 2 family)